VALAMLVAGCGDDSSATTTLGPGEKAGEVFLEPAGTPGPDSFTDRVLEAAVVSTTAPIVTTTASPSTTSTTAASQTTGTTEAAPLALVSMEGGEPGLYGGTQDQSRCDKEAIVSFLEQNPEMAAAWVAAQNSDPNLAWDDGRTSLTAADLRAYFAELTPVTLIRDTRVTNHGFRDGLPTPRQSVLEAGTAVLIDIYGVPRSRCACGNPLIPPIASPLPPDWVGPEWPGFDPTIIIVVVPAPTVITQVIIIDINTGDVIIRPVGTTGEEDTPSTTTTLPDGPPLTIPPDITVGSGDVQVTLIWDTDSDMDLHVVDPDGFEIYFVATESSSGGLLDVDDIPSSGDTGPHVENIFWPTGGAPPGTYSAWVRHYDSLAGGPSTFTLEVRVGGEVIHRETGTLTEETESTPFEFLVEAD